MQLRYSPERIGDGIVVWVVGVLAYGVVVRGRPEALYEISVLQMNNVVSSRGGGHDAFMFLIFIRCGIYIHVMGAILALLKQVIEYIMPRSDHSSVRYQVAHTYACMHDATQANLQTRTL